MTFNSKKFITPATVPYIAVGFSLLYWLIDALIDVYIYNVSLSYLESVFTPNLTQLWLRGFVLLLFLLFSVYIKRMLETQELLENRMNHYSDRFDSMVDDLRMEMHERKHAILELEELSNIDSLTNTYTRGKLHEVLRQEIGKKYRNDSELSIIMCNINQFKKINDEHGHKVGDEVLVFLSKIIKNNIDETDVFARWGGGEFVILKPDTEFREARGTVENLQNIIASTKFPEVGSITLSFGVTAFDSESDTADTFVNRSDKVLNQSKKYQQ